MRSKYDLTLTVVRKQYNGRELFGKGYCTLVTCAHYGVNIHRLLVRGRRVENRREAESVRVTADAMQISPEIVAPLLAVPLLLVFLAVQFIPKRRG